MVKVITWKEFYQLNKSVIQDTPAEMMELYRTAEEQQKPKIKSLIKNWRRHERRRRNFCAPNSKKALKMQSN